MCERVILPDGKAAIVCGGHQRCACGRQAMLLCDWKVSEKKSGTCDRPICTACSTSPKFGKDLCRVHAQAWREWQAARAGRAA